MKHLWCALLLISPSTLTAQHRHSQKLTRAELIPGLGSINHPVSTKDVDAQKFFNQGLAALYGFNHDEASSEGRIGVSALQAVMRDMPSDAMFANNSARDVLMVAEKMLIGKIALAKGDKKSAFETLAK
ncbi:MAG TPA: hypothetical protein VGQ39_07220 [Pyrinomonadaceae bacterium]|nr:hypothetical protein [Pyrinomonadaceae bacterium]